MLKNGEISVVPWYNFDQFQKVYTALYSNDITKMRWAVDQISVWETRCHPSLSVEVEATSVLVRTLIQDILMINGTTLCQESDLQTMYSMALVRFTNLILEEPNLNLPMKTKANMMEIPDWIVDLRHQASHLQCPSLPLLRIGAEAAMKHLEKDFWMKKLKSLQSYTKVEISKEEEIEEILRKFQVVRFFIMTKKPPEPKDQNEMRSYLEELEPYLKNYRKQFIKVLIKDGIFVSFYEDCQAILDDLEFKFFEDFNGKNYHFIPLSLERYWIPIISLLHEFNALPDFLEALLLSQGDRKEVGQKVIMGWCNRIFAAARGFGDETDVLQLFITKNVLFDWKKLFFAATVNPSKYSAFILPMLSTFFELEQSFGQTIFTLYAIYQGFALDPKVENSCNEKRIFTLENLKYIRTRQDAPLSRKEQSSKSGAWSLASEDINWKSIPIGAILNQNEKTKDPPKSEEEPMEEEEEEEEEEEDDDDDDEEEEEDREEYVEQFIIGGDETECEEGEEEDDDDEEEDDEMEEEEMLCKEPIIDDDEIDLLLKERENIVFGIKPNVSENN